MKNLILIRHAKSSWKNTSLDDFDRPLNKRGKQDAPIMADRLLKRGINMDYIISSPAKRAADTAKIFAGVLSYNSEITLTDDLYEASQNQILEVIKRIDYKYQNILIVCHNPGLTNLVNYLSDDFIDNVPTTGMFGVSIDCDWKDISKKYSSIIFFDYPKKK